MTAANEHWIWIDASVITAIHDEQLAEHGGAAGVRDAGLLESALARPLQLAVYGEPDAAALAAAYGFGLAKNHPFIEDSRCGGFAAVELFLALNGWQLDADDASCVMAMLALAGGDSTEAEFAQWIRANSSRS